MARRRQAEVRTGNDHQEVIDWYRRALAEPAVVPWTGSVWEPIRIGPTWQVDDAGLWVLPEATIGWDALGWCGTELQHARGRPWRFTLEQARFVLWWFSVNPDGSWQFFDGVLQRLKGWGKDPMMGCLSYLEALGPCRVAYMDGDQPVATDCPTAWVQLPAVSLKQTKNTMRLMPGLISPEARAHYRVQVGKETIWAMGDERLIEAVTSSPTTLEGARATFVGPNETQHWKANNEGHAMAEVIERNAAKSEEGAARVLRITNAPEPSEDSQAQRDREAWEASEAGEVAHLDMLYDSLEAPPEAPLGAEPVPNETEEEHIERVLEAITPVVVAVRGDSTWLSPKRIVKSILDPRNPPSRSRRFWFNQITATEDAWLDPKEIDLTADPDRELLLTDQIVMFFDGSKSDDATGLVGCRLSDGHVFELGVWAKPAGARGVGWVVNRMEVDQAVRAVLAEHEVVAFWADPSHAKDDDGASGFWDDVIDGWHRDFSARFKLWSVASGAERHSVLWDMTSPERSKQFTAAAERFASDMSESAKSVIDGHPEARTITWDGTPVLRMHLRNAKRYPNRHGVSLWKGHRESSRKIDLAVCSVGARMLRRRVLNRAETERSGVVV